jgi:hypothetical protein
MKKHTMELGPSEEELHNHSYDYEQEVLIPLEKSLTTVFSLKLNDRKIWINEFLLSKPYATGKNLAFFDHVFCHPKEEIKKENLPDMLKTQLGGKSFTKILSELNFTGEILKAFFPKRGKSTVFFRKNVHYQTLIEERLNMDSFFKELKKAHIKNNPK